MTQGNRDRLLRLLQQHKALGISDQIDFDKFYLYSIITHSTAIEGSTVTEVEAQLLFDEGITSSKRTMLEQQMNLLQWEFDVLPTKVLKEDKAEYIQALIDSRENEAPNIFLDCMAHHHCQHLQSDIDQFVKSTTEKVVDKQDLKQKIVGKWSIKPSLAEKMVDILEYVADKAQITTEAIVSHFGFNPTTAKRYLRQLTEFGYLESHGGNKNRTYTQK